MPSPDDLRRRHLISPVELAARLGIPDAPVILDIRFRLNGPDGSRDYLAGHLPDAVYVDLPTELAGREQGFSGRRPLPAIADLERDARRWGISAGRSVVVYDNNGGQQASRAWWVLRWAGVKDVRLLDGGYAAWVAGGLPTTTLVPLPLRGDVALSPGHLPSIDADGAARLAAEGRLIDARDAASYRGRETAPGEPWEGHIPGAINLPTSGNLDPATGAFATEADLRARFAACGITAAGEETPLGVYCGGGVTATHELLALATLGIDGVLFPGSWSAWSADPARPVAHGDAP
ncbi:sulfurtransferase [Sinirhodobacter populi]|uniref:Sulfurtransferase n=1 Tax=Paenirhodobacter populi TaxID=2306993 RepID=A0A443K4J3_9RHOB|nr:sulfurtransferase [Sinirhodobacter populi]RWR27686.1 sulfurtransferase [Sinirhodobacter populi]